MPQIFGPRSDRRLRRIAAAIAIVLVAGGLLGAYATRSDLAWGVGESAPQPIPFRHDVHVQGLGIDCRYCHSTVERHGFAGMPSTHDCLTCHVRILSSAAVLEPLHTSQALGTPVPWVSVHRLPSFIRFHHGIHVQRGVACETCHGQVGEMAETTRAHTLSMAWCLDCHRHEGFTHLTDCSTCHR